MGHIISPDGIQIDPGKTKTVEYWPVPKTITEGSLDYSFRALHRLTEGNQTFINTSNYQDAFQILKEAICLTPILAYPVAHPTKILLFCYEIHKQSSGIPIHVFLIEVSISLALEYFLWHTHLLNLISKI